MFFFSFSSTYASDFQLWSRDEKRVSSQWSSGRGLGLITEILFPVKTSSTIAGLVSCMLLYSFLCKERLEAVLQVIYLTRAFHKDQKMNKQRAGEGNPTLKRLICKTNMAHVRKSCIIQATETLSAILGFLSVHAFACDYLWSNQNSEIAPKQTETKHSVI